MSTAHLLPPACHQLLSTYEPACLPCLPCQVLADAFIAQMKDFDGEKAELLSEAEAAGNVLRFVGVVDVPGKKCDAHTLQP